MPTDRTISVLESAAMGDVADSWYIPIVDPNELAPFDQNKRLLISALKGLFLPLTSATANDVATLQADKSLTLTKYIQQAGYQTDLGNKTGATTFDWSTGAPMKKVTLTGNVTATFTAPANPGWYVLRVVQDGTGGRNITWPTFVSGYPILRQAAGAETIVYLNYDGAGWHYIGHELNSSEYNIIDDPGYAAARAAGDFNNSSTSGFLTAAANRALALGCRKLVIPADFTLSNNRYAISDTWKVPAGLSVECEGVVAANWSRTTYKPAIEVGQADVLNSSGVQLILRVERTTGSNWTNDEDVGVRCHNLWNAFVQPAYVYGFCMGFQAYSTYGVGNDGTETGWAYNIIDLGLIVNCKRGLALWNVNTASWVNQNLWYGGRFAVTSEYKTYLTGLGVDTAANYPVGIYQYGTGTSPHNANMWIAPSFEIDTSDFATTRAWEIACVNAQLNHILFARNEGNSNHPFLKVSASGVQYNYALISYASTNATNPADWIDDASDQGQFNFVTNQYWEQTGGRTNHTWQSGNLGAKACQFDSAGRLLIPGLNWYQRFGLASGIGFASTDTSHTVGTDYVEMTYDNSEACGVYLDTTNTRNLFVKFDCADGYESMRLNVICFDSSGTQLTGSSPRYAYTGGGTYSAGAYGGSYQTGSSNDGTRLIRLHASVAAVMIVCWPYNGGGAATIRLKSISIASADGGTFVVKNYLGAFDPETRYYNGVPSGSLKGNWKEGQLVHQYNPTDINDAQVYAYVATNTWAPLNRVHVGTSAPADTNRLWVDTTGL